MREELQTLSRGKQAANEKSPEAQYSSAKKSQPEWDGTVTMGEIDTRPSNELKKNSISVQKRPADNPKAESKSPKPVVSKVKKEIAQEKPKPIKVVGSPDKNKYSSPNGSSSSSNKYESPLRSLKGLYGRSDSIAELSRALFGSPSKREHEPAGPSSGERVFLESMHKENYKPTDQNRQKPASRNNSQKKTSKFEVTNKSGHKDIIDNRKMFTMYRELEKLHKASAESMKKLSSKYEDLLTGYTPYDFKEEDQKEDAKCMAEIEDIASRYATAVDSRLFLIRTQECLGKSARQNRTNRATHDQDEGVQQS